MSTCGDMARSRNGTLACYISNHGAAATFTGTVTMTSYDHFGSGAGTVVTKKRFTLPEGPGAIEWFNVDSLPSSHRNTTSVISAVHDSAGALVSEHLIQLINPMYMRVPLAQLSFKIAETANTDGTIDIAVSSDKVALWVTLTTLAQGRFSDNVFFLPATTKVVQFIPFGPSTAKDDHAVLEASLRIEDFSMYRPLE